VPVEGIEQEPVTESQQLRLNPFPTAVLAAPNPSIPVPLIPIPLSPCALVISYVTIDTRSKVAAEQIFVLLCS
jgi:hypothetical protein